MQYLIIFLIYFIFIFAIYKIYFWFRGRKNKLVFNKMVEIHYLETRYKLDIKNIGIKKILNILAVVNSLIFSITLVSTIWVGNAVLRVMVMFILLFPLIFGVYHLIGIYYKRKGMIKNV